MAFKTAFISHVPDANPEKHRCELETGLYKLYVRLVGNQKEAIKEAKDLAENDGVQSILLCPGFNHKQIAEIGEIVGENVGISIARGDGPASKIAMQSMKEAGWFKA